MPIARLSQLARRQNSFVEENLPATQSTRADIISPRSTTVKQVRSFGLIATKIPFVSAIFSTKLPALFVPEVPAFSSHL